jgi:uncharacterized iron-regulated membrane protein
VTFRRLRRVMFQVHLWTGLIVGVYVLLISVTGSAVVFRREVARWALSGVKRGDPFPRSLQVFEWVVDLHDNLLAGQTGRMVNGVGAIALAVLMVTGMVIWWRGVAGWLRALTVRRGAGWRRVTFDLHGAVGIWMTAFLVIWAITGIYFAFPQPFAWVIDFFEPERPGQMRTGEWAVEWMVRLHFGRFGGLTSRILWTVLGLVPAVLFVTGAVLWWTRVTVPRRTPDLRSSSESLPASPELRRR